MSAFEDEYEPELLFYQRLHLSACLICLITVLRYAFTEADLTEDITTPDHEVTQEPADTPIAEAEAGPSRSAAAEDNAPAQALPDISDDVGDDA